MAPDSEITRLLNDIADGRPVDWDAAEAALGPENAREILADLKLLSDIARLHVKTRHEADAGPLDDSTDDGGSGTRG